MTEHSVVILHGFNFYPMTKTLFMQSHARVEITVASCFPGPDDALCWEVCDFRTGMSSGHKLKSKWNSCAKTRV